MTLYPLPGSRATQPTVGRRVSNFEVLTQITPAGWVYHTVRTLSPRSPAPYPG